jgi:hypothetical protein
MGGLLWWFLRSIHDDDDDDDDDAFRLRDVPSQVKLFLVTLLPCHLLWFANMALSIA